MRRGLGGTIAPRPWTVKDLSTFTTLGRREGLEAAGGSFPVEAVGEDAGVVEDRPVGEFPAEEGEVGNEPVVVVVHE